MSLLLWPPMLTLYAGLGMIFVTGMLVIYLAARPETHPTKE